MSKEDDPGGKRSDPELARRVIDTLNGAGEKGDGEITATDVIQALWHELEPEQQAAVVMGFIKEILPDDRSREIREKLDISPTVEFLCDEMGLYPVIDDVNAGNNWNEFITELIKHPWSSYEEEERERLLREEIIYRTLYESIPDRKFLRYETMRLQLLEELAFVPKFVECHKTLEPMEIVELSKHVPQPATQDWHYLQHLSCQNEEDCV